MTLSTVQISIAGKIIQARAGETIIHAIWAAGMGKQIQTGCAGGVCGACTVSVRFKDGRKGGSDLACMRPVEDGMEVFPCPVEAIPSVAPVPEPSADLLRTAYPTLNRCTKCGSCTSACPMSIPVMDSILRMQSGQLEAVAEDFSTCIHCGLCRMVCEDKVKPHNMGMWIRRSLGISRDYPVLDQYLAKPQDEKAGREWEYLLVEDPLERLLRARAFREKGGM
ncbi:MAG: succinate dehydrogenase [Nitrospinae bacterium RIFCSPLOWO2_12_FULL_47_7]|nr:MAG: succinate dehydrogenase [Nitrospinae bacterium RIFCSPLOWO2_12_FULL_47_7]